MEEKEKLLNSVWVFSASSEILLQRLSNITSVETHENKWVKHFLNKKLKVDTDIEIVQLESSGLTETESSASAKETSTVCSQTKVENNHAKIMNEIESDPDVQFDYFVKECVGNKNLFKCFASHLSHSSVERICKKIFTSEMNSLFLEKFYTVFIPEYLRREQTLFSSILLQKAGEHCPIQFGKLLKVLLKSIDIASELLQNYIQNMDSKEKSDFLNIALEVELTLEEFNYHLFTIYIGYKDCNKTEKLQNDILDLLKTKAQSCDSDKNFGKFLLAFLQAQLNNEFVVNLTLLEKIVESNKSPFKRPCMTLINKLKSDS